MLHVTHNKYSLIIGSEVTIGHNATVHGCVVKDAVLIGMGAVILDNALINSNSIVAADNDRNGKSNITGDKSVNTDVNSQNSVSDSPLKLTRYKVKIGDTLEKISMQFYKSNIGINMILKQNKIKNKSNIKIGQELDLPNIPQ